MKTRKEITLAIDHIGAKGDGAGTHDDLPVYVSKTAPGDVAKVWLESQSDEEYRAKLINVETPGPARVTPPCPYFNQCGGCALQHVSQDFYHEWKIEKIKNALARADVRYEKWEDPIFLPHATRRRATLNAHKINNNIRFGYNEARTHNILDIKHCMVLEPALDAKIQGLRPYLPRLLPDNKPVDIMIQNIDGAFDLVLSGAYQTKGKFSLAQHEAMAELAESLDIARISWRPKDFAKPEILFARRDAIKRFGALSVRLSPGAFLQASAEGENALTEIVLKNTHGARAIADLFCGAGTFAGALLKSGVFIHAIDGDPGAITALSDAAKNHGQLKVSRRDLFRNPLNAEELKSFDTVIFDPPRAGAKEQATALAASKATKIIGISCNPATFARDAKILQEGGYVLQSLTLVDQFVWTAHVEMVGVFSR